MRLIESCHVDTVSSCSANPFGSGKDKNEDEQEDFTGLQYFKIPAEISRSRVEYCNHVRYFRYYRYIAVNFWRVKLWRILQQFAKFTKVFHHQSFPLYGNWLITAFDYKQTIRYFIYPAVFDHNQYSRVVYSVRLLLSHWL